MSRIAKAIPDFLFLLMFMSLQKRIPRADIFLPPKAANSTIFNPNKAQ